ncbi:MAG TPA: hypothetical protein VEL82_03740 [Thermoplasmata archaeon]|nr:hypothetical protein [Thermoplasmata archaeon]
MTARRVLDWLLEDAQPSVRYRALTELQARAPDDPEVRAARARIPSHGWAAEILARASPEGWWTSSDGFYWPKYTASNWQLLLLSELGVTREMPGVDRAVERWVSFAKTRFGGAGTGAPHHCVVGNMARALLRLGYVDDDRVRRMLEWITESADPRGGWSCFGKGRNLDSWEGLSALAAYPKARRSAAMQRAADAGAEFFLERELHRQGARYPPWYRFHSPVHYYYDVLVGLDMLTALGFGADPRLRFGLGLLRSKRRADGRWNLDAIHPDVQGSAARWYRDHPKQRPTPLALEPVGRPSKLLTLTALGVLRRVGG